jgi:hypothetical protein
MTETGETGTQKRLSRKRPDTGNHKVAERSPNAHRSMAGDMHLRREMAVNAEKMTPSTGR